ncbi:MAG: isochorismatase family protein [Promethearchaeota archaeon]
MPSNNYKRLYVTNCVIILIDYQKAFERKVFQYEETLENVKKLLKAARILKLPVVATEQNPKGLGQIVESLAPYLDSSPIPKTTFSVFGCKEFIDEVEKIGRSDLIFAGIESHICVSQSALDALNFGYRSVVLADCVTSRNLDHKTLALERLRHHHVEISFFEAFIYEILEEAPTPQFKALFPILKW